MIDFFFISSEVILIDIWSHLDLHTQSHLKKQQMFLADIVMPNIIERGELPNGERILKSVDSHWSGTLKKWISEGAAVFESLKKPDKFAGKSCYIKYVISKYKEWLRSSNYQSLFQSYEHVSPIV